jgi:hypothetical protein
MRCWHIVAKIDKPELFGYRRKLLTRIGVVRDGMVQPGFGHANAH